ncbi:MAG: hypothetical protein JO019_04340 [Candidatus Kaiserbacteria bacterium]|nr:hypothetical protein [Candidatus Kaiserbacteria bacterium]
MQTKPQSTNGTGHIFPLFAATDVVSVILMQVVNLKEPSARTKARFDALMATLATQPILTQHLESAHTVISAAKRLGVSAKLATARDDNTFITVLRRFGAQLVQAKSVSQTTIGQYEFAGAATAISEIAQAASSHGSAYAQYYQAVLTGALEAVPHITFVGDASVLRQAIEKTIATMSLGEGTIVTATFEHLDSLTGDAAPEAKAPLGAGERTEDRATR